jgi:hypothetical protein
MSTQPDQDRSRDEKNPLSDVLSGFNAEDVVDDPDELDPKPEQPPAATPDSPNPI